MTSSKFMKGEITSVVSPNRNTSNFLELIELYQEIVGVITLDAYIKLEKYTFNFAK